MASISLVSVNIERSKHLDKVIPFLRARKADVVCIQELMEYDIARFEHELGAKTRYVGNTMHPAEGRPGVMGVAILTALPVRESRTEYYWGDAEKMLAFGLSNAKSKHDTESHAVLYGDVEKGGETFRIATTHFTWTPDGRPDDYQREDLVRLFSVLDGMGDFALCGDFNAPRVLPGQANTRVNGEIFAELSERYTDNIPQRYSTSIDAKLHRAGDLDLMVDGLFTTSRYKAQDVELHDGVSDHMAITATLNKL